jgi:phage gp36-like protein
MPRWTAITIDDLNDTKLAALVDALRTAALAGGQDDPSDEIIRNVVARIRAEISGCKTNVLDIDPTKIPNDLKSLACRMIIREMQSRLQEPLNEDERQEKRDDLEYLRRIAKCEVPVAVPDDPETTPEVQQGGGVEVVTKSTILTTREQMSGL